MVMFPESCSVFVALSVEVLSRVMTWLALDPPGAPLSERLILFVPNGVTFRFTSTPPFVMSALWEMMFLHLGAHADDHIGK